MSIIQFLVVAAVVTTSNAKLYYKNPNDFSTSKESIIRGKKVSGISSSPFVAFILDVKTTKICGGSIITERHILTAAHCVCEGGKKNTKNLVVRTGSIYWEYGGQKSRVSRISCHEKYLEHQIAAVDDIAILELQRPLRFSREQKPIRMEDTYNPGRGAKVFILGWGVTEDGVPSKHLRLTKVSVVPKDICANAYKFIRNGGFFCARDATTDSCSGDSGGPAVYRGRLVGIVAGGGECAKSPAIYTSVPQYRNWILENLYISDEFNEIRYYK